MATPITINEVIFQYNFITRLNKISNKYSINCLIPQDHPQVPEIINACNAEWGKIATQSDKAQSMGYMWVMPNDASKIAPDVMPMLDQSKQDRKSVV